MSDRLYAVGEHSGCCLEIYAYFRDRAAVVRYLRDHLLYEDDEDEGGFDQLVIEEYCGLDDRGQYEYVRSYEPRDFIEDEGA